MAEYVKRRQKPVKEDARVTKTKERLRESLLDLMEDKPSLTYPSLLSAPAPT